jgi:RNA polymerase sigma-70 factor (ECF subfamily)
VSRAKSRPSQSTSAISDETLAKEEPRTREGFAAAYARHAPRLYRYFWVHTRSRCLAEDLVSETFLEALASVHTFRPGNGSFSAWLFGIGRRALARSMEDAAQWDLSEGALEGLRQIPAEDAGPPPEERIDLWQAVGELPPQERDVIALKFGAGLMHSEIAEITKLHTMHVGVVVYRALQRLQGRLNGWDGSHAE